MLRCPGKLYGLIDLITTWLPLIFPRETPNPVIFAPTVVCSILLVWFLGGGTRAGDVGSITVLHITTLSASQGSAPAAAPLR